MIADRMGPWRLLLALLPVVLLPLPALAWNAAGHRLVACIAWEHLDEGARYEISQLLSEHPDDSRWIKKARKSDEPGRIAFIEASTWPDDTRKDNRFYNEGVDEPTPTLPGFPDMARRRSWHYVNRPLDDLHQQAISGLLAQQLATLANTVGSSGATINERIYALPWLIHLTGDAHQPLHTSTRLDAGGQWDKLGNGMNVLNPFNPRKNASTLHAYWDDLPGPTWLRGERLVAASLALTTRYLHPKPSPPGQWIEESWQIAKKSAYPPGNDKAPTINQEFFENTEEIANRRVAEAGYRLADLLRELLNKK